MLFACESGGERPLEGGVHSSDRLLGITAMLSPDFWSWFDDIAPPKLADRTQSFRKIFTYLDGFDRPIGVIETGCVRQQDNWAGDGQSTILFDKYAEFHPGSA